MKKVIVLMLILLLCFSGCAPKQLVDTSSLTEENKILALANNTTPYNKLITKEYSLHELNDTAGILRSDLDGYQIPLRVVDEKFKVECLRKIDDKNFYVVYKTKEGGLYYLFLNEWAYIRNSYYSEGVLKEKEFSKLKVGDSAERIMEIDKVFKNTRGGLGKIPINYMNIKGQYYSVHITDKAVYFISYSGTSSLEIFENTKIKDIIKSDDMKIFGFNQHYTYEILSIDK